MANIFMMDDGSDDNMEYSDRIRIVSWDMVNYVSEVFTSAGIQSTAATSETSVDP